MIPISLQDYLVDKFKEIFTEFHLKNAKNELGPINVYPQNLPSKKGAKDSDQIPYILVGIEDGEIEGQEDADNAIISILIATFDDSSDYQGYRDAINVANKIIQFLSASIVFDGKHSLNFPIKYVFPEDNTYPYYFLGLRTTWECPHVTMNNDDLV